MSTRGNLSVTETFDYDPRGRLVSQSVTGGATTTYTYGNRTVTTTTGGRSSTKKYDAWGGICESENALNGRTLYRYHSSGQPKQITAAGASYSMTCHPSGRQKTLCDPNAGTTAWTYNALGLVTSQISGGKTIANHCDRKSRLEYSVHDTVRTDYTYNDAGLLSRIQTGYIIVRYSYNQYGRLSVKEHYLDAASAHTKYYYNTAGQVSYVGYPGPGNVSVLNEYDAYGNLVKVLSNQYAIWELTGETGTVTTEKMGYSYMRTITTRNALGQLANLKTMKENHQARNMDFVFDAATGNLTSRTGMIAQKETFGYDGLDRLTTVHHGTSGIPAMSMSYAAGGNIMEKTGVGEYTYSGVKPHAVEYVDDPDGLINSRTQTIQYNAFQKASVLIDTVGNDVYRLDITYGPDEKCWKTVLQKNGSIVKTILFFDHYEKITKNGVIKELVYMPGRMIRVNQSGQQIKIYYTHTDQPGQHRFHYQRKRHICIPCQL